MRIMAFGAHPDDVEMNCAGTLAKYADQGHAVAIAVMTNGEVGSPTRPKEEIAAIREQEARAAAAVIDAEFFWLGYPDEFLFNTPDVRGHVIDVVRQFRPDIIIAPDKDLDYHPDHTTTGQILWDIHVMVTVPNIATATPPCERIAELWFMDTVAGINFQPEQWIDITSSWPQKAEMLACHQSQEIWLQQQYGTGVVDNAAIQARFRGYQAGCTYAEAFRRPQFFPQPTPSRGLLPTAWD